MSNTGLDPKSDQYQTGRFLETFLECRVRQPLLCVIDDGNKQQEPQHGKNGQDECQDNQLLVHVSAQINELRHDRDIQQNGFRVEYIAQ